MAAVNIQMMSSAAFLPHTRSASVSSSSPGSRPTSSHGLMGIDDIYASPYTMGAADPSHLQTHHIHHQQHHQQQQQQQQQQQLFMLGHSDLMASADSPPHHGLTNAALKAHLRPSHMRARAAASPYPRDTESVHSSSSETEDMAMFMGATAGPAHDYGMYASQPTTMVPTPDTVHTMGAFGRMTLSPDHALEKLAANVRAATTTSASDRAKQIFVQAWLNANYAPYPDGNVPRQGLYFSYRRVCDQYGIPHINTATLGKAIRLCFPNIKTRRLGVRGNSKYHYCGIRPATTTEAEWLQDYIQKSNNTAGQSSVNAARLANEQAEAHQRSVEPSDEDDDEDSEGPSSVAGGSSSKRNSLVLNPDTKAHLGLGIVDELADKTPTAANLLAQAQASHRPPSSFPQATIRRASAQDTALALGPSSAAAAPTQFVSPQPPSVVSVRHLPHFPSIEEAVGAGSTSPQGAAARDVWGWFLDHLDVLLESVRQYRFDQFEMRLRGFWTGLTGDHREIVHAPAIAGLMARADAIVYDEILEILRSQMLSPIPPASINSLRQLANKMENILVAALQDYGNTFVEPKVELGARFGHLVLRFLDIYQVTQALNTVLTNQKQLIEMRRSWAKIDFDSVRNQSALVCNCRHSDLVQLLEHDFVAVLDGLMKSPEPVRDVMSWADKCCERLMGPGRTAAGGPGGAGASGGNGGVEDRSTMSSRSVLIRWGYVTSQIMRDLTIRSDPAFGAFQILKLFLDDWIAVNVLRSVALSTNSVAASVEPMMQQQFFSLSPMAGQENFGANLDVRNPNAMAVTPTTSSMLAALQQETFASDPHHAHHTHPHHAAAAHHHAHHPGAGAAAAGAAHHVGPSTFHADTFGSLSYMDHPGAGQDSGMPDVHQSGMFDFTTDFEVPDISIHPTPPPPGEVESQQQQQAAVQSQVEQASQQQQQQSRAGSSSTETRQQPSESESGKVEATTTNATTTTAA